MVKRAVATVAAAVAVHLGAATASAGFDQDARSLDVSPPTSQPGEIVIIEYDGCLAGDIVEFTLAGSKQLLSCIGPNGLPGAGSSRAVFTAPNTPGSYLVEAGILGNPEFGVSGALNVVGAGPLPPDELADTGSAFGPAIPIATTAVVVGVGLVGASRSRRRATAADNW